MGNIYEYVSAVFVYWWALVPSGVFAVDSTLEYFWDNYRRRLNRYVSKETRRKFILGVSFLGVFLAGFLAWRDEHMEVARLHQQSPSVSEEVKGLRNALELAQEQLVELQRKVARRRIPEEMKTALSKELWAVGSFEVSGLYYQKDDNEAYVYAKDFQEVLRGAGWSVPDLHIGGWDDPRPGVQIVVSANSVPPQGAVILTEALQKHQITVELYPIPGRREGELIIMVSGRP